MYIGHSYIWRTIANLPTRFCDSHTLIPFPHTGNIYPTDIGGVQMIRIWLSHRMYDAIHRATMWTIHSQEKGAVNER